MKVVELFSDMMQTIVNDWDPYINNLKKLLPLHLNELKEVQKSNQREREQSDFVIPSEPKILVL